MTADLAGVEQAAGWSGQATGQPGWVGIEALNVYCGLAALSVAELFTGRGLDRTRLSHVAMDQRSISLPCEDPVTNAVNAARPIVEALGPGKENIELLITSTESGVDYSKSVASYAHHHLGLSPRCRVFEAKQACYAATATVQLATGYVLSGMSPGAKALVIATDVAMVDARAGYAEPATGTGAAAMLIGTEPAVLRLDVGAFGMHSYETLDSARPGPNYDIADVDTSLFAYLDCLSHSFAGYREVVADVDLRRSFDYLALHTPFAGLVRAAHRKLMREQAAATQDEIDADFQVRVAPSLVYPSVVGNLCSGSVYLALASLIDNAGYAGESRTGLFSYGSGCASEFYSGLIGPDSRSALAPMRIAERLALRRPLSFSDYAALLEENLRCLVPVQHRAVEIERFKRFFDEDPDRPPMLMLRGIENYHRKYEWV